MGISFGDMLAYVLLGVAIGVAFSFMVNRFSSRLGGLSWILLTVGILVCALGLGWLYASLAEQEPNAGLVGFILFSFLGLVFGVLGFRTMKPAAK